jgi:ech hydrogenase subunit E
MKTQNALSEAARLLEQWSASFTNPEVTRLDVSLGAADLLAATAALTSAHWGYLSAITGVDLGPEAGEIEVLYHFCSGAAIVTLRLRLPRHNPVVASVCSLLPSASLYERELMEMLGVEVRGTPDPNRLFLPDDWPHGVYPLRKDFKIEDAQAPSATAVTTKNGELVDLESIDSDARIGKLAKNGSTFVLPIGPQHPALKEPGHFEFIVDGEVVVGASVRLGYVHRGIEKGCEDRSWVQALYLLERICGICSHVHTYAYCLGVERLANVEIPPRAQAIRELVAGLERIHSHMLWLGVAAHEAGFDTLFMYSWRDRETVMDLLEGFTGNRVNYSANVLGGVKVDIDEPQSEAIIRGLEYLEKRTRHYLDIVTTDASFLQRTRNVGVMTAEQVEALGVVGPTARASGVVRDIRVEAPYGSYTHFPVSAVRETAGDLEAKFAVRLKEMLVSYKTIPAILDNLPLGDIVTRMPRRIPAGETISRVEAPRGELLYYIKSGGGERPERVKVRTPSMCNFASVIQLVVGHQLADVPLILAGIDPCFSCNDRSVVVREGENGVPRWMAWEELRRYGIDHYRNKRA